MDMRGVVMSGLMAGFLITASPGGAQTIREATGANAAGIQATVDAFRTDLGTLNPNNPGSVGSGRREINWDGVPDADAAPGRFPGDFFNKISPRGAIFESAGSFQVSADAANPAAAPVRFGNLNANYVTNFATFSPERLFATLGSNVLDVVFVVPGSTTPATTRGFGAVFTDVDQAGSTRLEFFDETGDLLLARDVLSTAGDGSLSFLGISYSDPRIARVRITAGNGALGPDDITQAGMLDAVAMDDFIYGEPIGFSARLVISPPTGTYATTQSVDLTLFVTAPGRTIMGGGATVDGVDVTGALASCVVPGSVGPSGMSLRCPGVPLGAFGVGTHSLSVTLVFDDGSTAKDKAIYAVTATTEP